MNRENLETLYRNLIEHHDNGIKFDIRYWVRDHQNECGTTACACGLYILKNPNKGLALSGYNIANGDQYSEQRTFVDLNNISNFEKIHPCAVDDPESSSIEAVCKEFGISVTQAQYLFVESYYYERPVTPLMVAEKVAYLLANETLKGAPHNLNYLGDI